MDLSDLLHPTDADAFVREYWEQRPLVLTDRRTDFYAGLFSLADVDHMLSAPALYGPMIKVVHDGRGADFDRIGRGGAGADHHAVEAVLALHHGGATILLSALERAFAPLRRLCDRLGQQVSARFQVNAYLTPPSSQGFATHCDTHDVFVLQIAGTKRWTVFDAEVELPLRESPRPLDVSSERPLLEQDLRPGALLYIPRGFPHHAVTTDATSLHLTVGAHPPTWATLLRAAVENRIDQDARFRASLPVGFAAHDVAREEASAAFRDLLNEWARDVDAAGLVDDAADSIRLGQLPVLSGRLLDIESEARIDENTPVKRRAEVACEMSVDSDRIRLRFGGKIVSIPDSAAAEVSHLLESEKSAANQLPGDLDEPGRVVLIRRLVREGLLTICPPSDPPPDTVAPLRDSNH